MSAIVQLKLDKIDRDAETHSRAQLSEEAIQDYSEVIRDGIDLPPIVIFRQGSRYFIGDGWHRFWAYDRASKEDTIPAEIRPGDERDALLYAASANHEHGVRRTAADKRICVEIVLDNPDTAQWSSRMIAEHCHVGHPFVEKIRKQREPDDSTGIDSSCHTGQDAQPADSPRVGKDGKARRARKKSGQTPKPDPKPAPKAGKEVTSPAVRKECKALWGKFIRAMDVAMTEQGQAYSEVCSEEITAISEKMTEHWGGGLK